MNRSMLIFVCVLVFLLFLVPGCGDDPVNGTGDADGLNRPVVVMETTYGEIVIVLFRDMAPMTVMNFLEYVDDGFYEGLIFHRVIPGFIIQGGGFDENLEPRETRDPIRNEADNGLSNIRGTISMARTYVIHSATSQFFFNTVDNTALDHRDDTQMGFGYCVFGAIIEGMVVLDAIAEVETGADGDFRDVPVEPVFIIRIYRVR